MKATRSTPASHRRIRLAVLLAITTLSGTSCTTYVQRGPGAGVVAQLSVERFLQAANDRDIDSMGRLFGTEKGPIMDTGSTFGCFFKKIGSWFGGTSCIQRRDVEVRLDAIARVLRHQDYRIVREEALAGRMSTATRVYVDLTVSDRQVRDIPFVVVRAPNGQWLVEQIDLERVMARR